MIEFFRYTSTSERFLTYLLAIYEQSFPVDERRPIVKMLKLIENEPRFKCNALIAEGELVGFFNYWDFNDFIYVEHFAIDPLIRGRAYGSSSMKQFLAAQSKPVILEVERPETLEAERRIGFYQRLGFTLCKKPYIQPAYEKGQLSIPMYIMEAGGNLTDRHFKTIKETIYREVYNVEPE